MIACDFPSTPKEQNLTTAGFLYTLNGYKILKMTSIFISLCMYKNYPSTLSFYHLQLDR